MRIGHDEKLDLLRAAPLFEQCSQEELEAVARTADELDLPAGEILTVEGRRGREFVVLIDGTAEVTRQGEKLRELGPGDFFGEIALIARTPRTATVTATSPVRALVIEGHAFRSLLDRSPALSLKVLHALAERLPAMPSG